MTATPNKMSAISASTERRSMSLAVGARVQPFDGESTGTLERIHTSKDGYLVGEVLWDTGARCGEPLDWLGRLEDVQAGRKLWRAGVKKVADAYREQQRRELPERECDGCSKHFSPAREGQRFHSESCRKKARYLGVV
jgi:hypothetical protein